MSKNFNKIKSYYDNGLYNEKHLRNFVVKKQITADEFKLITGIDY